MKSLPLLIPSKEVIATTLDYEGLEAARSLPYMERILKRFPTFIWLSKQRPTEEQLSYCYRIGVEFYHATSMKEV